MASLMASSMMRSLPRRVGRMTSRAAPRAWHRQQQRYYAAPAFDATLTDKTDDELVKLVEDGKLLQHHLETKLDDASRAVGVRRKLLANVLEREDVLAELPHHHYDYTKVIGACAENVVGYIQIPVGYCGPLKLDGKNVHVPMATTEGALIASTHRGCKAISESGGATTVVLANGMTRAPLIKMPNITRAAEISKWLEVQDNFYQVAAAFNSTSRFARLASVKTKVAGRHVYMRFKSRTGDAMGMNMVSKGVEKAIQVLEQEFPDMDVMSLSGNFCTDKKPSAINWVDGRGKSVVASATITKEVVRKTLKSDVDSLIELNIAKNLIGSAMAGSIGGNNAHASNVVTAIFLATGQDPAQNVESSNCMTLMEKDDDGNLFMTVTMPSIEVGTVGGGTHLPGQAACLDILGIRGSSIESPGSHAESLARVVASSVLAGELSLMSALAAGHLVKSHLQHNRKSQPAVQEEDKKATSHTLASLPLDDDDEDRDFVAPIP
eukprot:TRINITY_DN12833_c1_g1_i1.p1 TRINITY_DN12833_c1_g1~~TRINITY_DN12833_c1_g1_i1.p1  ORF type:complete len:505 (-),score=142.11 TRINITY_DN12833_c1_g1_i1:126-1607(-)